MTFYFDFFDDSTYLLEDGNETFVEQNDQRNEMQLLKVFQLWKGATAECRKKERKQVQRRTD